MFLVGIGNEEHVRQVLQIDKEAAGMIPDNQSNAAMPITPLGKNPNQTGHQTLCAKQINHQHFQIFRSRGTYLYGPAALPPSQAGNRQRRVLGAAGDHIFILLLGFLGICSVFFIFAWYSSLLLGILYICMVFFVFAG